MKKKDTAEQTNWEVGRGERDRKARSSDRNVQIGLKEGIRKGVYKEDNLGTGDWGATGGLNEEGTWCSAERREKEKDDKKKGELSGPLREKSSDKKIFLRGKKKK